jgi:NADP-dependent alcohol dehydrogenase
MALNGFVSMGVSQDWATHMIGHELTALHGLTHGHTLTIVLPGTMWVMREEKGDKILQYGKRVWNIEGSDRVETIRKIIDRTEEFFRSLGLKTKLSENGAGVETIDEIERRFAERKVKFGENRTVDSAVARKILEKVL